MQKIFITATIALFSFAAMAQDRKVAVFDPVGNVDNATIDVIREEISSIIVNAGGYTVLERQLINRVLEENRFQMSGLVADAQVAEMGRLMGANFVVITSITRLGSNLHISCKMIEVETARIERQRTAQTQNNTNDLIVTVRRMASELLGVVTPVQQIIVDKLVADKRKVYAGGEKINKKDARVIMSNTDALRLYNKGVARNRNGNICVLSGLGIMTAGTIIFINQPFEWREKFYVDENVYYRYDDEAFNNGVAITTVATGLAVMITGAIIKKSSKQLFQQAANSYNTGRGRANVELDWTIHGNGLQLTLKF